MATAVLAWRNWKLAEEKQVAERFSKAVEMLGDGENIEKRLGGIYSLERIALDSPEEYHWTIMEILTAFVREKSPAKSDSGLRSDLTAVALDRSAFLVFWWKWYRKIQADRPLKAEALDLSLISLAYHLISGRADRSKPETDIQAALTVIGRRKIEYDPEEMNLNLADTNLQGANLEKAKLRRVNLRRANLQEANLRDADLKEALLRRTELREARLDRAKLQEANLEGAKLEKANLTGANLEEANLTEANLEEANLLQCNLRGTDLSFAKLQQSKLLEVRISPETKFIETDLAKAELDNDARSSILQTQDGDTAILT